MSDDSDYVTLLPTRDPERYLVTVMRYRKSNDEYWQERCSQPMPKDRAESMAQMWGEERHLEVR